MRMLGVVLLLILALARPAHAHAILVESSPAIGAVVSGGQVGLRLRFNSRIDRARSRLTLMRDGRSLAVLPITNAGSDDLLLSSTTLQPGAYVVRWQVLAIDGHITRGDVAFTVEAK